MKPSTKQGFTSLPRLPGTLTIIPQVFAKDENLHVDSVQDESRGNAK